MYVFNLPVTRSASLTNIVRMNARTRVSVRKDVMRCVAGGANSSDSEALREQTFSVHTHRIILEDIYLRNIVSS